MIGPVYPYRGGIAHYTHYLDQALRNTGNESLVISFRRQYPGWLYPGNSDKDPSQMVLQTQAEFILDALNPWTWYKAVHTIVAWKPDLVAIQWWTTFWAIPFALICRSLRRNGISTAYIVHNVLPHEERLYDKLLAKFALSQGNTFVVHTLQQKELLLKLIPKACLKVCPFPIYAKFKDEKMPRREARQKLGLPQEQVILLFFGIVRPYKGLSVLLEALHQLKMQAVTPYLVIAGEFWEAIELYKYQINQFGLNNQVILINKYIPNEDVVLYFSAADVMVAPYIEGTQSAAAALARGYGLPLIITEQVAQGMGNINDEEVRVVPTRDPQSLAKAIKTFMESDHSEQTTNSGNGFDWRDLVEVMIGIARE